MQAWCSTPAAPCPSLQRAGGRPPQGSQGTSSSSNSGRRLGRHRLCGRRRAGRRLIALARRTGRCCNPLGDWTDIQCGVETGATPARLAAAWKGRSNTHKAGSKKAEGQTLISLGHMSLSWEHCTETSLNNSRGRVLDFSIHSLSSCASGHLQPLKVRLQASKPRLVPSLAVLLGVGSVVFLPCCRDCRNHNLTTPNRSSVCSADPAEPTREQQQQTENLHKQHGKPHPAGLLPPSRPSPLQQAAHTGQPKGAT